MKERLYNNAVLIFIALLLLAGALIYFVDVSIKREEQEQRALHLAIVNEDVKAEVEQALGNFSTLISGVRSYIKFSEDMPSSEELRAFIIDQTRELEVKDSMVISYVDANHIFRYSFTRSQVNPDGLVGTSVKDIVGAKGIRNLESVKRSESFKSFGPVNLVEGRVGITLDFGILKNGESIGYISAITDFKPIVERIYSEETIKDFVFRFRSHRGVDFDRERVYDKTRVNNPNKDPEYYKNFDVTDEDFIYSEAHFHGIPITIGTAYKEPYKRNKYIMGLLLGWFATLIIFLGLLLRQIFSYKKANAMIHSQSKELSKLMATKNRFYSIIAHDLRSPLASIIGFTDLLKEEEFEDESTSEIIGDLQKSTKGTLKLLDNLLSWSKLQTGDIKFKPKYHNLEQTVNESANVLAPVFAQKEIELISNIDDLVDIYADKEMVATIIRNLLSNAVKFSKEKGIVNIYSVIDGDFVNVAVQDNGIGISEDNLKKLFDIEKSFSIEGTKGEKGTGLGLLLCKEFVEMNHGKIWVESKVNKGTTFIFSLPLHKDQAKK